MITETLWLVNTRTCNLNCAYCYQGSHRWTWQKEKGLLKMMPEKVIELALPWAVKWATRGLKCAWYGGEPLLNFPLIKSAVPKWEKAFKEEDKELRWCITTNGTMLNAEVRDFMDEHKMGILLSLDGPPEVHNRTRVYFGGKPSWKDIPIDDIFKWRENFEIAWQLDPSWMPGPEHLDWMIDKGFHQINFNPNWMAEWSGDARIKLEEFMQHVAQLCIQTRRGERPGKELNSNWMVKFDEVLLKTGLPRSNVPCGTGTHMLGLSPEGWLYPSQDMVFSALDPDRAPGTPEYYRVGDVHNDPVIDQARLDVVSQIRNDQMIPPKGFDCNNCISYPISFGGCHCRYVGQDGVNPANRFNVEIGWCQVSRSALTGLLQGAVLEKYVGLKLAPRVDKERQTFKAPRGSKLIQSRERRIAIANERKANGLG